MNGSELRMSLRAITHLLVINDIVLVVDWVRGILNKIPDFLSRPELHKHNRSSLAQLNARIFMSSSIFVSELHDIDTDISVLIKNTKAKRGLPAEQ